MLPKPIGGSRHHQSLVRLARHHRLTFAAIRIVECGLILVFFLFLTIAVINMSWASAVIFGAGALSALRGYRAWGAVQREAEY